MIIQDLFDQLLGRLTGPALCSIFEAVREVQGIVANRLLLRRSDLLRKEADAVLVYSIGEQIKALPADFGALVGRPFVVGSAPLSPLSGRNTSDMQTPGPPKFYEMPGRSLRIHPVTDAAVSVQVPYFFKPPILADLADELPFSGEFDSVFVEGCAAVLTKGLSAVADRVFVSVVQSQVDGVLDARALIDEQLEADAINGI